MGNPRSPVMFQCGEAAFASEQRNVSTAVVSEPGGKTCVLLQEDHVMAQDKPKPEKPDSTGTNSRPREDSIGQTEQGIPDDSSKPVTIDEDKAKVLERKIRSL